MLDLHFKWTRLLPHVFIPLPHDPTRSSCHCLFWRHPAGMLHPLSTCERCVLIPSSEPLTSPSYNGRCINTCGQHFFSHSNMTVNLESCHAEVASSLLYAAHASFLQTVTWRYHRSGRVLVGKTGKKNALVSLVARVIKQRLDCGPCGNYTGEFGTLASAKYHLQITKPAETPFAEDYDLALQNFRALQDQAASTEDRRNFIVVDGQNENLRFTCNVFEKRVNAHKLIVPCSLTLPNRIETSPVPVRN